LYNPLALIVKEMDLLTLFINLTPFIPPSKERGKRFLERGFAPLLLTLPLPLLREGGQGDRLPDHRLFDICHLANYYSNRELAK